MSRGSRIQFSQVGPFPGWSLWLLLAGLMTAPVSAADPSAGKNVPARSVISKEAAATAKRDQAALLNSVGSIAFTGTPGEVLVFGERAFPVVTARSEGREAAYIGAARAGKGRLLALGHDGVAGRLDTGDTRRFFENAFRWLGNREPKAGVGGLKVGVRGGGQLVEAFQKLGVQAVALDRNKLDDISRYEVVYTTLFREEPGVAERLLTFVENGGGLIVASHGWGWIGFHARPGERLDRDAPSNLVCGPFGLAYSPEALSNPDGGDLLNISGPPAAEVHVAVALEALRKTMREERRSEARASPDNAATDTKATGKRTSDKKALDKKAPGKSATGNNAGKKPGQDRPSTKLSSTDMALGLRSAMESLPLNASFRQKILEVAEAESHGIPVVTRQRPASDSLRKAAATLEAIVALHAPVEKLRAAPSSKFFPGEVPAGARRVPAQVVDIDTDVDGFRGGNGAVWQSTGLYAAPGEIVEIRLPEAAVKLGLRAQVGCHADDIARHSSWSRPPSLVRKFDLDSELTRVGSGYGGLLYILVPPRKPAGVVPVTFTGAVRAPTFVYGKSDPTEWRFTTRDFPAPFGELVSDLIVLTVLSSDLKKVESPEILLEQWRKIVDCYSELAGIPFERKCPERFVPDHQISAGWLHSGYPIMAQDLERWSGRLVSDQFIFREGEWGFFHELGHNHQESDWTFDGTTEVTCNVFGMYVFDTLFGGGRPHDSFTPEVRAKKEREYIAAGRPFDKWKKDPFLALVMYEQLVQGFGWDPFKKVFREYRTLAKNERPKSERDQHDEWMVRMSKATGHNLGPFFEHWGIPVSDAAREKIRELPEWQPDGQKGM